MQAEKAAGSPLPEPLGEALFVPVLFVVTCATPPALGELPQPAARRESPTIPTAASATSALRRGENRRAAARALFSLLETITICLLL
jgi:hypothetical protein